MTDQTIQIKAPNLQIAKFKIIGTAPFVQLRFSEKKKYEIQKTHEAGSTNRSKKKKEARDFSTEYEEAMYKSEEGWRGIPAAAFRNASISACRTVGFKMTHAKLAVFVLPDGFDKDDATPLVRIYGKPEQVISHVRNATGVVDLRTRAMWKKWHAEPRIQFDADMFSLTDVTNLLARVGKQVGIGEGRPDGKTSAGVGWGLFDMEAPK